MSISPALLSMSMLGLAIAALITFQPGSKFSVTWDLEAIRKLLRPWQQPELAVIGILFLIVLVSGLQGGDMTYWLERLRIKLPLLVIPLMFIMFPAINSRQLYGLYYFLLLWMTLLCIGVGINYLLHMEAINTLIKQGQPMPTPRNHIRFSLLLAYTIVAGAFLYWKGFYWKYTWERKLIAVLTVFLFLFMHVLSVRSGLAVIYSCILVMGLYYTITKRKYWIGSAVLALIVLMPLAAYHLVPSFKAKLQYMSYDQWMHQREMGALYADSGRITSLMTGLEIFLEHPILGIGVGHIQREVDHIFTTRHPDIPEPLMPHNQLLYVLATTGILGFLTFILAYSYPFFYRKNYRRPMLLASYVIFTMALMLEHSLEISVSIAFHVLFLCLLLNHYRGSTREPQIRLHQPE